MCVILLLILVGSGGMSNKKYSIVSEYVTDNYENSSVKNDTEFFEYESTGLCVGGIDYGYYFSADNEVLVPDYYSGGALGEKYSDDGGTYFGKPDNGTDWYFAKKIVDKWYYYELHWS